MIRRFAILLGAAALLVAISAADTQAARHRGSSQRGFRSSHSQCYSVTQTVAKPSVYPRVRQISGKTLWDLGKQNGQWPSF